MNFLNQILGRKKEEEDTEFDEIVREAKRQVESGQALPPTTSGSGVADEEFEPLPAPTGSAQ